MAKIQKQEKKEITRYYLSFFGDEREVTYKEYRYFWYKFARAGVMSNEDFKSEYVQGRITKEKDSSFVPYSILVETEEEHRFLWWLFNSKPSVEKRNIRNYDHGLSQKFFCLIADE